MKIHWDWVSASMLVISGASLSCIGLTCSLCQLSAISHCLLVCPFMLVTCLASDILACLVCTDTLVAAVTSNNQTAHS